MPATPPFYSVNEIKKPVQLRVYHNNSACPAGKDIPKHEQLPGTGNYRLCDDCAKMNRDGK